MDITVNILLTIATAATPLLIAAMGELVVERSGVLNLGVEGMMIMGAVGGFGSQVLQFLAFEGLLDHGLKVRPLVLPDLWMEQAKPEVMYAKAGLDRSGIVTAVFRALGQKPLEVGAAG